MAAEERHTERTSVRTYVPAYQRDRWDDHAAALDMSRSEFVRTMVQAGRRGYDPRGSTDETEDDGTAEASGDQGQAASPLETEIVDQLAGECLSWDELFEAVTDDIEAQLEATLQELQAENRVQYSGPKGGYVLLE